MSAACNTAGSDLDEVDIVSLDPASPVEPLPLIADILRTRYCIPRSVFLVEGIEANIRVGGRYRTVRVLLGDGELVIQALMRPEMHFFLDGGQIYEGCYVKLNRFDLDFVELEGGTRMPFLMVEDMITVGLHRVYLEMLGAEVPGIARRGKRVVKKEGADEFLRSYQRSEEDKREVSPTPVHESVKVEVPPEQGSLGEKKANEEVDYFSDSEDADAFETLQISVDRAAERRTQAVPPPVSRPPVVKQQNDAKAKESLPWMANDPTEPMKLTDLRSIPRLPYKQNWMVNLLAVVAWLSDIEPSYLPPGRQRRARLVDSTTSNQVLLTVLLDPEAFTPRVGSVVLLVGVKNHQFEGGSLRKYMSDKPKSKNNWWISDPETLSWCEAESKTLREWWDGKMHEGS